MVADTALIVFHSQTTIYMNTFFAANRSNETARRYCVMPVFFSTSFLPPFCRAWVALSPSWQLCFCTVLRHGSARRRLCDDSGAQLTRRLSHFFDFAVCQLSGISELPIPVREFSQLSRRRSALISICAIVYKCVCCVDLFRRQSSQCCHG